MSFVWHPLEASLVYDGMNLHLLKMVSLEWSVKLFSVRVRVYHSVTDYICISKNIQQYLFSLLNDTERCIIAYCSK